MKKFVLPFLFWFASGGLFAQQNDAVFLAGIHLERKIDKKTSINFFNQYALNENYTELGYYFFTGGLSYRLTRNFSCGLNYRFSQIRNLQNFYQDRQAVYGDLIYSKGRNDFSLSLRMRYQVNYYGLSFAEAENYKSNKHFLRSKATLRYRTDPENSVYVSCEQIYRFDTKDKTDAWRAGAGFSHEFNLHQRIDLSYSIYKKANSKSPDRDYVTSLTYYYRF